MRNNDQQSDRKYNRKYCKNNNKNNFLLIVSKCCVCSCWFNSPFPKDYDFYTIERYENKSDISSEVQFPFSAFPWINFQN